VATRRNDHLFLAAIGESHDGRPRLSIETAIRLVVIAVGLFMAGSATSTSCAASAASACRR
jgi:hypothetical protein